MLNVYEFDGSVQPGAKGNHFEVYRETPDVIVPLFYAETLDEAVKFCYASGNNFTIHTLEAWEKEYGEM